MMCPSLCYCGGTMDLILLAAPAAWAKAVATLPAAGPLPCRTVLVPSERHAHALRRDLARTGNSRLLAGTRFVGPLTAAIEVLHAAGIAHVPGEEALRPGRLLSLFSEGLPLEHFDVGLLRSTRGWHEAFAHAIGVLESAGLAPADLPRDTPHARDLALVWSRIATQAGASFTAARTYLEAAAILERDARYWPFHGRALAAATGHEDVAMARFLRAIPDLTLGLWVTRPLKRRKLDCVEALFGPAARAALAETKTCLSKADASERDLLAEYLFQPPEVFASPERTRSGGPDGTVQLEEHAGVEAELQAVTDWVSRKIFEEQLPLEEVAVLVPSQDPLVQLIADRLEQLPFGGAPLPVHVAGGLPAISTVAGARVLNVIRALESHMSADCLAAVLPALRQEQATGASEGEEGAQRSHLSQGEAMELAFSLGTVGGNAAYPAGALEWSPRAAARVVALEAAIAHAHADEDSTARDGWRLEAALENLQAIRPALDALVGVAHCLVKGEPLAALWERLAGFLEHYLLAPGEGAAIPGRLADSIASACASSLGSTLRGPDALEIIKSHLLDMRVVRGRFGAPAVYVGAVAGAVGLHFTAVRVIGLCEGVLPSQPREDPVLPERLRGSLEDMPAGRVIPGAEDRVAAQIHGLFAAVQGARRSIVLSAPRVDLARTERESSAIFIEAAAALGRPNATTGEAVAVVPDTAALRRDAFGPARRDAAIFRGESPISEANWLDRVARLAAELPPGWRVQPVLALDRIDELRAPSGPLGAADGVFAAGEPFPTVPGVTPERPISASALQQLLQCPRMFLMRRLLGWDEPASAPSLRELDALSYGSLFHRVIERFYRANGAAFVAREKTLGAWRRIALETADTTFEEFISEQPLVGEGIREKERARLKRSVEAFLEYDWGGAKGSQYVGVELPFGGETPLTVSAGGVTLHFHGFIDRVDVEGDAALVRDLKSGHSHPRRGKAVNPDPFLDVQLGLYQLAAKKLAPTWKTPKKVVAAYAYANGHGDAEERAFRNDPEVLEKATKGWLATAGRLLASRAFPPTPDESDCKYCPFHVLCGAGAARRAAMGLEEVEDHGALALFRALKLGVGEDE